ncbi:MAG: peptidase S8 [Firmicutes bacterium HGW-Firmicutes-8]|nr:MAG: peptidase S8 [Firmicutes bacterium HGW-Firmicutes-8]
MFTELSWVTKSTDKICPVLKDKIMQTYRHWKWVPRFLHKPLVALKHRLKKHKVIVQLNGDIYPQNLNIHDFLHRNLGCRVKHKLDLINGFSTSVNIKTLKEILSQSSVSQVSYDREVHTCLDVATPAVNAPPVWMNNIQGEGIGIAILDTGIYPHPDLTSPQNRIIAFKDFIKGRSKPYDDNGHGTHCAGDAVGNGFKSKGRYAGPAPKANLIGIKALNRTGSGLVSTLLAGIQWCINNKDKYGIRVLSMSLGGPATQSSRNDPLCQAVRKAWKSGIVVCAAAGNDGPKAGTINSPGIEPKIITVGGLDDKGTIAVSDDTVAPFSSRGPTIDSLQKPDVVAPGANIISLRDPKSYLDKTIPGSRVGRWYMSLSGTSMATPVCAGVAALILNKSPSLTPDQVKTLLIKTCRNISLDPNAGGAGLVDAKLADGSTGLFHKMR